jgi:hypothetical protein
MGWILLFRDMFVSSVNLRAAINNMNAMDVQSVVIVSRAQSNHPNFNIILQNDRRENIALTQIADTAVTRL